MWVGEISKLRRYYLKEINLLSDLFFLGPYQCIIQLAVPQAAWLSIFLEKQQCCTRFPPVRCFWPLISAPTCFTAGAW